MTLRDEDKEALASARNALINYLGAGNCKRIWLFTDPGRAWLADAFATAAEEMGKEACILSFPGGSYKMEYCQQLRALLGSMQESDLVVSLFSDGTQNKIPYFKVFPHLRSPEGFSGLSCSIRPRYCDKALLKHLSTCVIDVDSMVQQRLSLNRAKKIRVTAPGGTDVTLELISGIALPYKVVADARHAFLPPAEVTFGVVQGSAEGTLAIDVTVGEVATRDGIIDALGLVDEPVQVTIEKGYITSITGGDIAQRLNRCLAALGTKSRLIVELGFGLSEGTPTGMIGPDECLQGTCHFGVGNDFFYSGTNDAPIHLDLVLQDPQVEVLEER